MRALLLAFVLVACGGGQSAVPPSATTPSTIPTPGTWVDLQGGGRGYLVAPASQGKHGAVIVIQEWWGVTDWILTNSARFASSNYVALAVDLYRGKIASNPDEAHELSRGLPQDRALADLEAGFAYLASRPDVDPARIGAIGWCMGGGYALDLAVNEPRLRAAVVNYGHVITSAEKIASIKASILGNFGGVDRGIPADDVRAFESALQGQGKEASFKIYDAAGHAFMNPTNTKGYDDRASKDAWERIDAFFTRTLSK